MPAITDPVQETFPEDDRLYRIYWGGELLLPKPDNATSRVRFWLKEVDEEDREIKGSPIVQVTESVGAIPRLTIGSHWRNGRKARPKNSGPPRIEHLEIVAPPVWNIVRACDRVPDHPNFGGILHTWINRSEMALLFNTSTGQRVRGLEAWVVSARTIEEKREIIIPCYEIFRSFFGGTSDLSFALLSQTWDAAERKFIVGSHESASENGVNWHIDLANRVPHCAVPYLSWLHFDKTARKAANKIYAATVNQMTSQRWISAAPPVTDQTLRIVANVVHLRSRNALLVTKIAGVDFPLKVAALSYTVDWRDIPVSTSAIDTVDAPQEAIPIKRPSTVSKPVDRRRTLGYFELPSVAVKFSGLPVPTRSERRKRFVPIPDQLQPKTILQERQVSVGASGNRPAPTAAQFTPEEERTIEDRFQAIKDLVDDLMLEGKIDEAIEYPLVRPAPACAPTYCEFPSSLEVKPWPWSMVRNPIRRPRLALVLQLAVKDRLVYWIETEATGREYYRSLAVEMVDGGSLDERTLAALLDICVMNKGIWPHPLPLAQETVVSVKAYHATAKGQLSQNFVLLALARLERARTTLGEKH